MFWTRGSCRHFKRPPSVVLRVKDDILDRRLKLVVIFWKRVEAFQLDGCGAMAPWVPYPRLVPVATTYLQPSRPNSQISLAKQPMRPRKRSNDPGGAPGARPPFDLFARLCLAWFPAG